MNIEIPEAFIAAQRELLEAEAENRCAQELATAAHQRWFDAMLRRDKAWGEFQAQIGNQVRELVLPAEEGR